MGNPVVISMWHRDFPCPAPHGIRLRGFPDTNLRRACRLQTARAWLWRKTHGSFPRFVPNRVFREFSACHVCIVALPPSVTMYRKNIPELEVARLQTKGKRLELQKSSVMAIELIDRKESASYKGSIYELTLLWDRESIRKCFCGMPPFFAHIRKDGANFATIDCYSNDNGRFAVKKFMPSLLARPDWQVRFDKDINTIPLLELLAGLPI